MHGVKFAVLGIANWFLRLFGSGLRWRIVWLCNQKFIVSVSVVVFDSSGRVLLLKHRLWANQAWGIAGGYVKAGETAEDACRREIAEETGYEIAALKLVKVVSGMRLRMELVYTAVLAGGTRRLDPSEVLDAQFFEFNRWPSELLPAHRAILESVRN